MKTTALIVAGGIGKRVGGDLPKQFQNVAGQPLLFHTLRAFETCPEVDEIFLVLPEEWIDYFKGLSPSFSKLKGVVRGGQTRQDSTRAGFQKVSSGGIVLVHDGARPLVSLETIRNCIETAREYGAALAASPASDTIKESDEKGFVSATHDRKKIHQAQTPQAFRFDWLKEALESAYSKGIQATDEAALVEQMGKPVKLVFSEASNIKITHPVDLIVAEALLGQAKRKGQK
ncbi:MAG: 2-C-methyl-D-erythritol 4-phosphate cytidylyltransferase [bacterium]